MEKTKSEDRRAYTEDEIRYAVNLACGCSPLTIMRQLMWHGRIWMQDRIIKSLKEEFVTPEPKL